MRPLDDYIKKQLDHHIEKIGQTLNADVMAVISPILPGLDTTVRNAIEKLNNKLDRIAIVVDTGGGVVEVVERMVGTIRHFYSEVTVIVPDRAMSAGTIFALSADTIMMDYYSCLGPIDPQVEKEGNLVPALSYLIQFQRLNEKATQGSLTTAEYALLSKLDLGELYRFEQARDLSKGLLIKWLSRYKFKDWSKTATRQLEVDQEFKERRAKEVAEKLSDPEHWRSHGRGIDLRTLRDEVGLQIEDYSQNDKLRIDVREYFDLLRDYMLREKLASFVHTKEHF